MFETFPFLLGAILNYQEYFSLISMLIFFAFAILFYILYYIFKCLEDYFIMQKILYEIHKDGHNEDNSQPFLPDSVISNEKFKLNGRYIENSKKNLKMNSQQEFFSNYSYQKSKLVKTLFWIAYFWGLVCWICLSFTPICWSAFGKLSIPVTIFILLFLYYVRFFSDVMDFRPKNMKLLKNRDNENFFLFNLKWFARINIVTCRRYKFFYIGANVLIIFSSIFLPFLFQNSCITFHNPSIGFLLGETDFSTKLTRQSLSERCPEGAPCHIYVTLPENATNSVFLNFHTNQKHENTEVLYDEYDYYHEHKTLRNRVKVKRFDPELEPTGSRYVYSSLITDLKAKNSYAFGIFYDNTYQSIKIYNTLPNFITDNDTVVFVNGGDVGSSASVQALTNSLITQLPNVLFIGYLLLKLNFFIFLQIMKIIMIYFKLYSEET